MRTHDQGSAAAARDRKGRCSARRKRATVLRLLRGEDLESVSRELGITAARASQWRDQFLTAGQAGLKSRAPDARDEEHQRLHATVGELLMETERLYATVDHLGGRRPFGPAEVDAMKGAQSISTRRAYGVQRICRVWGRARSSVYARRHATRGTRRGRAHHGAAGRSVPPRMTSWWPTFVGCSKPRRFMARATEKCGRSCGSRGSAPRRSGCGGSCGRTTSRPRTAGATRTARRHTTARSPRRPPMRCGERTGRPR